jgi:hypothetical protein
MTSSRSRWLVLIPVGALILAGVASVAFAIGATSGGASVAQAAQTIPGHPELGPGWYAPGTTGSATGAVAITITNIAGDSLSLKTTDGWTRTIDATGATITKGGQTIAVADLKVGDQITFREARQSDGSYKITAIQVVLPTASGTVTAVTSDSVTITQSGGTTEKLTLTSSTSYSEAGATVSASSLVVGARISAKGTVDSAGNFTATAVTIAPATVQGKVASKTSTTILVTTTAGKTVTVDVSSATKYSVSGVSAATLDNVAVGYRISATGTLDSSGTLHATAVQASPAGQPGFGGGGGGFGRGHGFGGGYGRPSPGPSAAASGSNT